MKDSKKISIKMMLPYSEIDSRPIAPVNLYHWFRRSKGFEGVKIDFTQKGVQVEEWDDYIYIKRPNSFGGFDEFIRYSVKEDKIYIWKNNGTHITTIKEFVDFCAESKVPISVEEIV